MTAVYLESSALLSWLQNEEGEEKVRSAVDGAESVWTSALTYVEVDRVLVKREYAKSLTAADRQNLRGALTKVRRSWMTLGMTENILRRASEPFPVEPVRTLDAIHLATAIEVAHGVPGLTIVSLDRRILENATALGLR